MKTIFRIARTELQVLFYSPIAWLILIIFTFQTGLSYTGKYDEYVRIQSMNGHYPYDVTFRTFAMGTGLFNSITNYLYLYIPLLTMGVMSREYASGSIKLLYSSPVNNYQIILGKYLALMLYGLLLIGTLFGFVLFSLSTIDQVDVPLIFSGLLGLYLLICAYSAIGLFMSSITSYTVVAAMGTLATLALLNYINGVWQDVEIVRDVTYWLAISGRCETFISGLITSEDTIYFIMVIILFVGFSIVRLQAGRQKSAWYVNPGKYAAIFFSIMAVGYFCAMPTLKGFYDTTRTKRNTLPETSQAIMRQLKGELTINTYVNMFDVNYQWATPKNYKIDVDRFKQYLRFKPDMKIKHHYYYHGIENSQMAEAFPDLNDDQLIDTLKKLQNWTFPIRPYREISDHTALAPENFLFVRELILENGKRTFLRLFKDVMIHPDPAQISAAFNRLALNELPVIGFISNSGERGSTSEHDRGYNMFAREKSFRYALVNQGFDAVDLNLDNEIPGHISIVIVAEPKDRYNDQQLSNLEKYIESGGNLIIAGEPRRQAHMNQITKSLGVRFLPGVLVSPSDKVQADLLLVKPTEEGANFSYHLKWMLSAKFLLTMPTTSALEFDLDKGFDVQTLFTSDSTGGWNEVETTDFVDDSVRLNPSVGEIEKAYPTVLALSRHVNGKDQKILVTGDADWLSNGELGMNRRDIRTSNFSLINAAFFWMTDGEMPIDMRRDTPPDKSVSIGKDGWAVWGILLKWIFPGLLIIIALVIWIRRRGR